MQASEPLLGLKICIKGIFFFLLPLSSLSNSAKFNQGFCWRPWVLCLKLRLSSWLRDVKSNAKSFILRYVSKKEEKKCNLVEPVQKIKRASASGRSETHLLPCWGTVVQKQNKKTLEKKNGFKLLHNWINSCDTFPRRPRLTESCWDLYDVVLSDPVFKWHWSAD